MKSIKLYLVVSLSLYYCNLDALKICASLTASQQTGTNAKNFHHYVNFISLKSSNIPCDAGIFIPVLNTRRLK